MDKILTRVLLMCSGGAFASIISAGLGAPEGVVVYLGIVGMLGGWVIALGADS